MATNVKIIRHKNPKGRTTWYRAIFYDEKGRVYKSPCYDGKKSWSRHAAQNWLYANTHIWVKIANVEQRVVGPDGKSIVQQLGTEEIV